MGNQEIDWDAFEIAPDIPKIYDRGAMRMAFDELPTLSVRDFATGSNPTTTDLASIVLGSGSTLRVSRLKLYSSAGGVFYMKDQSGTIDIFRPGSMGKSGSMFTYPVDKHSGPKEPLYVTRGQVTIYHIGSKTTAYDIGIEGYKANADILKPYRDGH